jgi:hypothetical protein
MLQIYLDFIRTILGLYTEKLWSFSVKVPEMFRKNAGKVSLKAS